MERIAENNERLLATAQLDGLEGRPLIVALVALVARSMLDHADILRVFMYRAIVDNEIWRRGSERSRAMSEAFEAALLEHRGELSHANPELAIDVAYRFVYNTVARHVTHGPDFESAHRLSDEELVRELGEAAADYLLAPPRAKRR
jgi:hypothetical protein